MNLGQLKTGEAGIREIADAIHGEHRTTQAVIVETLLKGMATWAMESYSQNRFDLRSKRAVLAVRRVVARRSVIWNNRSNEAPVVYDLELGKWKKKRTLGAEGTDLTHLNMYTC